MPVVESVSEELAQAREFAESVAGTLERIGWAPAEWAPGVAATGGGSDGMLGSGVGGGSVGGGGTGGGSVGGGGTGGRGGGGNGAGGGDVLGALRDLGWDALAGDADLVACAGLGAIELGRRLGPLAAVDGLLAASPLVAGDLVRCLVASPSALVRNGGTLLVRPVLRAEPLACADGLAVHRVLELGEGAPVDGEAWPVALHAWLAASVGYLAGLGLEALEMTTEYVRQRRAFGGTLAALAPVQQQLAGAATAVRGVALLAADRPSRNALAHAGPAIAQACAACHQVSGAIGFTLEHPLHRCSQRARALTAWNDALLDVLVAGG